MKSVKPIFAVLLTFALFSFQGTKDTYRINAAQSKIHWKAKKTTGEHEGDAVVKFGTLYMNGETPLNGEFVVDMTTLTVTDIKDAENNKKLLTHLKSDDFFSVAKYPTSVITITKFTKGPGTVYTATADLTIKDKKNPITFPVKITRNAKGSIEATADITIDRTKWGVVYNSKTILGISADKFIYDDVNYTVNLLLEKK